MKRPLVALPLIALMFALSGPTLGSPAHAAQAVRSVAVGAITRTYTLDSDFDEGSLLNVNHESPNNDQLQLNQFTGPLPFINVACSQRGTVVRIDIETGAILGEYLTAPTGMNRNPSRTTVDKNGNVWVANRDEIGLSGGQNKGSMARIGVIIGGTRCDADGTPNSSGQYLKPPFTYSTVADRDGDGLIKTSFGLGNILPWTNAGGMNTHGGVSTAEDEAIITYTRVTGTNTRTLAVDRCNDVWVGGTGDLDHEKVNGFTGLPVPGTQVNLGCGGYGGLIDGNGVLWSAARIASGLMRLDVNSLSGTCLGSDCGDYGLGIDPNTGNIWYTDFSGSAVGVLSPAGACLATFGHGEPSAQGIALDGSGNAWVAHSIDGPSTTVGHLRTDGTFVGNVSLPGGSGPTGVAVDGNGKIWVTNFNSSNVMRIDPGAGGIGGGGFPIGAVDLTVDLGSGAGPYNYSDMTGFVSVGATSPSGTWTVVHDSGALAGWDGVNWTADYPEPAPCDARTPPPPPSVGVEVRAANEQADLPNHAFVQAANGGAIAGVVGRYLEVRTTLSRPATDSPSPVLSDLTIIGHLIVGDVPPGAQSRKLSLSLTNNPLPVGSGKMGIRFALERAGHVELRVFDISGRVQRTLAAATLPPGEHSVLWDGTDAIGQTLSPGMYFVRLRAENQQEVASALLLK